MAIAICLAITAYAIGGFWYAGANSMIDTMWPVKVYRKWKESRGR